MGDCFFVQLVRYPKPSDLRLRLIRHTNSIRIGIFMTASHGVGTYGNAVGTVTPTDHKLGNAAGFAKATSSLAIRPGVMWGGADNLVTGTSGMTYNVAAFSAVLSRGGTSGAIALANDGVVNVATTAAPGSNSRYDVVYVWQREFAIDGTDSNSVIGVLQGSTAASPTVPALTAFPGAIALATILVPAGVTATNTGTTITQAAPFTAAAGGVVMFRNTTERDANILPQGTICGLISTSALYQSNGGSWSALGGSWIAATPATVSAGSGTAVINPSGSVAFTTVGTNVSLNGLFNDSIAHKYKIVLEVVSSTANTIGLRLRNATPTDIITNYDQIILFTASTTTSSVAATAGGTMVNFSAGTAAVSHYIEMEISNPAATAAKTGRFSVSSSSLAASPLIANGGFDQRDATSYTGLSIIPSAGTITGRITVTAMLDI